MWNQRGNNNNDNDHNNNKGGGVEERKIGVAIEKNKGSRKALKWALENVLNISQTVSLIHVQVLNHTHHDLPGNGETTPGDEASSEADLFHPFRSFCSRRQVLWETVLLEGQDIAKELIDYVCFNRIDTLVLSAPARSSISRLFKTDIPSMVLKGAPHFCNVYVISKRKVASFRAASHPIPLIRTPARKKHPNIRVHDVLDSVSRSSSMRAQDEWSMVESDRLSYISQGRMSTESNIISFYNNLSLDLNPRTSRSFSVGARNFDPLGLNSNFSDIDAPLEFLSSVNKENGVSACSIPNNEELEEKMRRLELQLKQTMDMYHGACKEALTAKQKERQFQLMKIENDKRLVEVEKVKQEAMATADEEKEKCEVAFKLAKAAYRRVDKEKQKRVQAEIKASEEAKHKEMILESINQTNELLLRQQSLLHIVVVFFFFYIYYF